MKVKLSFSKLKRGITLIQVVVVVVIVVVAAIAAALTLTPTFASRKTTLNVWMLTEVPPFTPTIPQQWAKEFEQQHPGVNINFQFINYGDYFTKLTAAITTHSLPDIIYIYNAWIPTFVSAGVLDVPPQWVQNDVRANFTANSVQGVSYNGTIWGYPTETDDYMLLYNKALFQKAGISSPPQNWDQLVRDAQLLTVRGPNGKIEIEGFGVITGWDNGVFHPWLALLRSDGGHLFYPNGTPALTSPQAMQVAEFYYNLTHVWNVTDPTIPWNTGFETGHIAMLIMADWWEATLRQTMGSNFTNVGVAPIPIGPMGSKSLTVSYNWLWAVTSQSKDPTLAWEFLQFIDTPQGTNAVSPMGSWLMGLGIIPSRTSDLQGNSTFTSDPFLKPFLQALQTGSAPSTPIIPNYEQVVDVIWHTMEGIESGTVQPTQGMKLAQSEVASIVG